MTDSHSIQAQARYQCAAGLSLVVTPPTVRLTRADVNLPFYTLRLLEQFRTPTTFEAGIQAAGGGDLSRAEWLAYTGTLAQLVRLGALVPADEQPPEGTPAASHEPLPPRSTVLMHLILLNDIYRTEQYFEALRRVVQPGDVVLDIGTGSGVLSVGAAQAGARHVYAVEGNPVAKTARALFERNGLGDRITVIEDWSTRIELPERADVLVSEIISSGVFGQNVLETTRDALQRLLKPGARLIPDRVRMYAAPVEIDDAWMEGTWVTDGELATWRQHYHADFAPLRRLNEVVPTVTLSSQKGARYFRFLGAPALLLDLDLTDIRSTQVDAQAQVSITQAGRLHGAMIHFEADLAPGLTLTTALDAAQRPDCWGNPVWFCAPSVVRVGDTCRMRLTYPDAAGQDYRLTVTPESQSG